MANDILTTLDDGVLTVSFNRPNKKNSVTAAMYAALTSAIHRAEREADIKLLLFTGVGEVFSAGNDIGDFLENPANGEESAVVQFLLALSATDMPMMAAVNGQAIGVGTTMLMYCDKVYAVETATFSTPFINLAVVPEAGSSLLMPKYLGYQLASRMLIFGEAIDASEVKACGLVSVLCEYDDLMPLVMQDAKRVAGLSKKAMRNVKQLIKRDEEAIEDRVRFEMQKFGAALRSPEAREAMTAFLEKRPADFSAIDENPSTHETPTTHETSTAHD